MKCAYRQRVMQRLLVYLDNGRNARLNLYIALEMMAAAWAATGREIVANCFEHAGLKLGGADADFPEDPADCSEAGRPPAEALASWAALQDAGNVPCGVELDDFIDADADVIAH